MQVRCSLYACRLANSCMPNCNNTPCNRNNVSNHDNANDSCILKTMTLSTMLVQDSGIACCLVSCLHTAGCMTGSQGTTFPQHASQDILQVGVLSSSKQKQLQSLEALQTLQQSLHDFSQGSTNQLEGLAIHLQLPGPLAQVALCLACAMCHCCKLCTCEATLISSPAWLHSEYVPTSTFLTQMSCKSKSAWL